MFVKVEYVKWLKDELRKINNIPLEDITWIEDEKILNIDKNMIDIFDFTGLSNVDFVMYGEYKSHKVEVNTAIDDMISKGYDLVMDNINKTIEKSSKLRRINL